MVSAAAQAGVTGRTLTDFQKCVRILILIGLVSEYITEQRRWCEITNCNG